MSNSGKFCAAAILAALASIIIQGPAGAQGMSQPQFKRTLLMGANYSRLGNLTNAAEAEDFAKGGLRRAGLPITPARAPGSGPKARAGPPPPSPGSGPIWTASRRRSRNF